MAGIARLMEKTGAKQEDIETVREIISVFLRRMKKRKPEEALMILRRKIDEIYLEISEADWIEWVRKDVRRWQFVDKALAKFNISSRKELMNLSYMMFIKSLYLGILRQIEKKIKSRKK